MYLVVPKCLIMFKSLYRSLQLSIRITWSYVDFEKMKRISVQVAHQKQSSFKKPSTNRSKQEVFDYITKYLRFESCNFTVHTGFL